MDVIRLFFIFAVFASQCFAVPPAHGDTGSDTGNIEGWSYSEIYAEPSEVGEGISVIAIFRINPSINGREYIVTDESGFFAIPDVPVGEYTLQPLYSPASYSVQVAVERNKTSTVTVLTPEAGIYLYVFNCSKQNPPFFDADVRRALAMAIDRQRLLGDLKIDDREPAVDFIPTELRFEGWANHAKKLRFSPSDAESLLQNVPHFACSITFNVIADDMHAKIAASIGNQWEALSAVEAVMPVGKDWFDYISDYFAGDYDVLRLGWSLDSNNLVAYFRNFFGEGNKLRYENPAVITLLERAETALRREDIPAYEDAILTMHNILVEEAPAIPLYYY